MNRDGPSSLTQALKRTIDQSNLPYIGFDVVGVGDASVYGNDAINGGIPIKLLVKVEPGVTWAQGMRLARDCHTKLVEFGLDPSTIHCEVFEAKRPTPASGPTPATDLEPDHNVPTVAQQPVWWPIQDDWDNGLYRQHLLGFTQILGQSIATTTSPGCAGSSGVYLQLEFEPNGPAPREPIFALLTNRNVVVAGPDELPSINHLSHHDNGSCPTIQVIQPSENELKDMRKGITEAKELLLKRQIWPKPKFDAGALSEAGTATYKDDKWPLSRSRDFERHCGTYNEPDQRIVGEVVASPKVREEFLTDWRYDWALIRLESTKFGLTPPQNHVLITNLDLKVKHFMDMTTMTTTMEDSTQQLPAIDILRLNAYFTLNTVYRQDPGVLGRTHLLDYESPVLHVFMSGAATKGTHGILNRVRSYHGDPKKGSSWEASLCIIAN
jgi:hypothetical protein